MTSTASTTPYEALAAELAGINYNNLAVEDRMDLDEILALVLEDIQDLSLESADEEEAHFEDIEGALSSTPVVISF